MDQFEWANQTLVHPAGIAVLVALSAATLTLPRRYAPIPLLIMACMIPSRQRIVIFDLDWTYLRLLVLAGWAGVLIQGGLRGLKWITLDKCVIALGVTTLIASTLRTGSAQIFVRSLGVAFDGIGTYLLFRVWIRSWRDVEFVVRALAVIGVPVAVAMAYENQTGYNIFHVFGGVPEFTLIREGRLRCQGAFAHPILAGCFWASLLPLFAAQVAQKGGALWAALGASSSLLCVAFSASSTPLMGALAAMLGGGLFLFRNRMRAIRWSLLGLLVALHIVMKAPVWHLISRIDAVGGSTGWHRYILIDRAIQRFGEWFLLGIDDTRHWGHGMLDVTNEYLVRGFSGGFIALCIFIAIISYGYQAAGRIWRSERRNRSRMIFGWALGVSLFSHTMMFIAVSYFGQIKMIWALLLAMLGSIVARQTRRVPGTARGTPRIDSRRSNAVGNDLVGARGPLGAG